MIEWILQQLEKQPSTLFYETALRERNEADFLKLKEKKLLTYVQPNSVEEVYSKGQQEPKIAVNLGGRYAVLDDESPEAGLIFLDRADLIKYSFSFQMFAKELAFANHFSGSPEKLHRRLYYAGECLKGKVKIALLLALFDQEKNAEDLLLGLPNRLPGYDHWMVVTPTFVIRRPALRTQLEGLHVHVAPLEDAENLKVDMSIFTEKESHPEPTVVLNAKQQKESAERGYKCDLPIVITGETAKWHRNEVLVNGFPVLLGDSLFLLFLRLVLGLYKSSDGAVTKAGLRRGGFLKADSEDQTIGHLRAAFTGALGETMPRDFIQSYGRGTIRLSTHPALVKCNKAKLAQHHNEKIRRLAVQLA